MSDEEAGIDAERVLRRHYADLVHREGLAMAEMPMDLEFRFVGIGRPIVATLVDQRANMDLIRLGPVHENGVASMAAMSQMDGAVARLGRSIRRSKAIRAAGGSITAPPIWAYDIDALLVRIALDRGETVEGMIERVRGQPGTVDVSNLEDALERMRFNVRVLSDVVLPASVRLGDASYERSEPDLPGHISFHGRIPHTILNTIVGRPIGEVVRHPALRGADFPILATGEDSAGRSFAVIDVPMVPAGPLPPGDADWRRNDRT